jgi:predicted amidohydrolase YtcJ/pimeloyl-ACP methyl ester carboxylesterase
MKTILSTILTAVVGVALAAQPPAVPAPADLLVVNGKVYTADGRGTFAQAVAVRGNTIAAVGTAQEIERLRGPKTEVVDAAGAAIVPGFNDVHTHMLSGGLALETVELGGADTLADVQQRIRTYASAHAERAWIQGRGWHYEPFPGSQPTREQLDAAVPDRPAVMRCYDGHSIWVNSKALALAGITKSTPDPPNGTIVRDPKTGEPTGLLKESPASTLVTKLIPKPSRADERRALKAAIDQALAFGVTSVTDAAGTPENFEVYDELRRAGELQARVYYSLLVNPEFSARDADRFDAIWKAHPDTPLLKTGIVKMFMDGVIETNTAFMIAPYVNAPTTGTPNYGREDFNRIVAMLDRRGWQIMVHGLGDGAVRMVLDGFERAATVNPVPARGRRHRVEHVETIDLADVPRFGKLGVIASMHPVGGFFVPQNPPAPRPAGAAVGAWAGNIGPERAARGGMWKSISESGGRVVFGSDWPVATLDAIGRIVGISNRAPRSGGTDQRISLASAIDKYTSDAAYAAFDEKIKGTLAPGMLADIVVLATDVFAKAPAVRGDVAVKTTIVDGKVVYRAPASGSAAAAPAPQSAAAVTAKEDVVYGRVEGSALLADIAYPNSGDRLPAIISVHGGRWRAGNRTDASSIKVGQWAGFGFFAMSIDYRLVGGSPAPASYLDLLCAIRWVHAHAQEYRIDPERVYLIGQSAGGQLVSLVATLGEGSFKRVGGWDAARTDVRAVVSVAGPYELNTLSWGNLWTPVGEDVEAARRMASPLTHVAAKTRPILVIHSDDDRSVPIQQAVDFSEALKKAGVQTRFTHYTDKGHMGITEDVIRDARAFIAEVEKK